MIVPLADALSVLTPTLLETRLLRACVQHGELPREAWAADADGDTPATHTRRLLAPLLYRSLRERRGLTADALGSHLRAAALHEEIRWREYVRISHAALRTLAEAGITPVVVGGAALAETVYPDPATRHCDAIALLLPGPHAPAAARHLERAGFAPVPGPRSGTILLRHRSGLQLSLRGEWLAGPIFLAPADVVWSRSVVADLTGVRVRRLSSADALIEICVDGLLVRIPRTAQWAADAWYLIARSADLAWDVVADAARRAGAELPLVVALTYLGEALGAPVPSGTLRALGSAAARTSSAARDVCLYATRRIPPVSVPRLLAACQSWQSRLLLIKWLLGPAPEALLVHDSAAWGLPLSAAYHARLLHIARSCGRWAARRLATITRPGGRQRLPDVIAKPRP